MLGLVWVYWGRFWWNRNYLLIIYYIVNTLSSFQLHERMQRMKLFWWTGRFFCKKKIKTKIIVTEYSHTSILTNSKEQQDKQTYGKTNTEIETYMKTVLKTRDWTIRTLMKSDIRYSGRVTMSCFARVTSLFAHKSVKVCGYQEYETNE